MSTLDFDDLDGDAGNGLLIGGSGNSLSVGVGDVIFVTWKWATRDDAPMIGDFDPESDTLLVYVDEGEDGPPAVTLMSSGSNPVHTTVFLDDRPAAILTSEAELDPSDIKIADGRLADALSLGNDGSWR